MTITWSLLTLVHITQNSIRHSRRFQSTRFASINTHLNQESLGSPSQQLHYQYPYEHEQSIYETDSVQSTWQD